MEIPAAELPKLPEGEYYYFQLIGLTVVSDTGDTVGTLTEIIETGANNVYVVKTAEGKEIYLPAIPSCVLSVQQEEKTPPAPPPARAPPRPQIFNIYFKSAFTGLGINMKIDILSLFPEFIEAFFRQSMIKRALDAGIIEMAVTDPREFSHSRHHQVDDTIYGGGAGMLMQCGPLFEACESVLPQKGPRDRVVFLSPAGIPFTQDKAKELYCSYDHLVLICGHYEGVDHRVEEHLADELISIGDYVLTGGELGAMVISDAVARMVPGVLGDAGSAAGDSFYEPILEYPQYTKPVDYRGWKVPEILVSGHHANIARWRRKEALRRTLKCRPDLLAKLQMTAEDKKLMAEIAEEGEES